MSGQENELKKEEVARFPVSGSKALRIALEDSETSHFIKTNFSYPEQRTKIVSHKWISRYNSGFKWNVEIIEKIRQSFNREKEMINIAFIEVDSYSGKIIRRKFFSNIFSNEYEEIKIRNHVDLE